jgi:general secretion pathway protein K
MKRFQTGPSQVPAGARQRGVALITALLVVSLATMIAVAMATRQHIDVRLTGNLVHGEQAYDYALGAEAWARVILRRDSTQSDHDSLDEDWATALPPLPVVGGQVSGRIEDMQGRFNINNLAMKNGKDSEADVAYFRRLLELLKLDPALTDALLDWIDADIDVRFPDGAEDENYLLAPIPYRAANRPLVDPSELRLVKGFDANAVRLLEPYVTALPQRTSINVNTAPPVVLLALNKDLTQSDVDAMIAGRGEKGYPTVQAFMGQGALAGRKLDEQVDVKSNYFLVHTDVIVGQGEAHLQSLLVRDKGKIPRVISRTRVPARFQQAPQGDGTTSAND